MSNSIFSSRRPYLICVALLLLHPRVPAAQAGWVVEPGIERRLAAGEVVVQATNDIDPAAPRGRIRAAIFIPASPQAIWSVVTDCNQARAFVPGLKRCRR